MVTTSLQSLHK